MRSKNLFGLKLRISIRSALRVFKSPAYVAIAVFAALLISGLILWALNLDLVRYIIFDAPLTIGQKIGFFADVYKSMFVTHPSVQGVGILFFSILFGVNIALVVYVIKNVGFAKIPKKSGFGGLFFAVLGGGCIACGASILAPLLATFGATSTVFVQELSTLFNWIGVLLVSYSIYKLGGMASSVFAKKKF